MDEPEWGGKIRAGSFFLEAPELEGYYGLAVRFDRVLLHQQTAYQELVVAEAGPLGRVLVLDGNIQAAEFDETGYHEMLVHVPLITHPSPGRVLVVGGGDGGTLREVLRHAAVRRADLCEIDGEVIEASRRFLPRLGKGFDDPRVSVHVADATAFVRENPNAWDVILVDSSDPVGPAVGIFGEPFYRDLRKALRPGGIAVVQAESCFVFEDLVRRISSTLSGLFPVFAYYNTLVPTYTSGVIGFAFCSLGPDPLAADPDPARVRALGDLDYYTPALHRASFALPRRFLRLLPEEAARRQENFSC
ncbi:MAG: polyamine aminopropyltransferase [Deltaproteobacteria bacterium]|nr:polyamine aminopropyltransferase [Deltaproteobacteria bacterium]